MKRLSVDQLRARRDTRSERAFLQDAVLSPRAEVNRAAVERWDRVLFLRIAKEAA
jgi:hypothetical protein